MGVIKGIFDELKNELNNELEKSKKNSSSSEQANIEKIQKMFLGKSSTASKHHRDHGGVTRPQANNQSNKPISENQKRINELKKKNYEKDKTSAYEEKKKTFGQSFESKHSNSKQYSNSIRNKKAMMVQEGGSPSIHATDLSKAEMPKDKIVELNSVTKKNTSSFAKKFSNREDAKNAFIASIIFERKKWK